MYRYLLIVVVLLSQTAYADERLGQNQVIDFLSNIERHGFSVDSEDWVSVFKSNSDNYLAGIYKKYSNYISKGRLNKDFFQNGWMIQDVFNVNYDEQGFNNIEEIQSKIPQYNMLLSALNKLKWWSENAINVFPNAFVLFEGDEGEAVSKLNEWLFRIDLLENKPSNRYGKIHLDVLTKIQVKYSLIPDGRFGPSSRSILLAITNQRIRVIKANLERLRWLPQSLPYPHVWVDIPGFKVSLVKKDGVKVSHKAIFGTRKKQTPIFQDKIESFSINPVWKVPHKIAANYLLKKEKRYPGTLQKEGFSVYENWNDKAKLIPMGTINWNGYTVRNFKFRLEQSPGNKNSLGRYKFDMPNQYGIYLHDTNRPELFNKKERIFSSGCARVDNIKELVGEILSDQGVEESLDLLRGDNETRKVALNKMIPAYFSYFTAWPDENGRVRFRNDIYQLDNALVSWF
ncbi:MAG: L,D-transpeptidase family protein [Candidatus Endonucleobacter bathymodioli]|uniref:L,D-transpeptidase family protein n=1 Tax=Candidatus Endonucleibacter bathymodioli TaxID=539814 RepID=A0AA90SXE3_9GAMM|nr:L,D-transpeptidase family protein [Candidatus Endonucleobacter bathymodioli]